MAYVLEFRRLKFWNLGGLSFRPWEAEALESGKLEFGNLGDLGGLG